MVRTSKHSRERFGPLPFLVNRTKAHPARIEPGGHGALYIDMPLLGSIWTGEYRVRDDHDDIDSILSFPWARAEEVISLRLISNRRCWPEVG